MPTEQSKPRRVNISRVVRFEVFKRDSFTCQYCQRSGHDVVLHLDHKFPVALGGDNRMENLITSCEACNLGKQHTPLTAAKALPHLPVRDRILAPFLSHSEAAVHSAMWQLGVQSGDARTVEIGYGPLAESSRTCKRTVQRIVHRLIAKGFIQVMDRGYGSGSTKYTVTQGK